MKGQTSSVPKVSPESGENLLLFKGFLNSYNAFIAGELAVTNITQDNQEHINPADVEEMDILWQMEMAVFRAKNFIKKYKAVVAAAGGDASTSKALVSQETDSYDWSDQVQELELTLSHAFMAEVDEKQNEELFSDKESNYRDARHQMDELTSELEHLKSQLSKSKIQVDKYEYASTVVANMIDVQCRRKVTIGIGFTEVKPPFNHNYSIMSNINTSVVEIQPKEYKGHSTITKEAGSKLNPNCEPFVPTGSLEQAFTSSSSSRSDCDVKPFDVKEFHEKVCCFACGRPRPNCQKLSTQTY
ncbi:hypothetical protein R6Q57_014689 [Mikania cordata]